MWCQLDNGMQAFLPSEAMTDSGRELQQEEYPLPWHSVRPSGPKTAKRKITHPLFKNVTFEKAVEVLQNGKF
ncbi:hypothetical protein T492DRAFT_896370 [Pavlovales sp. CCMP2436]|nr:hypothetical protein T492DRAFT_896370 [Pavlovales sp. CCMP2436]